MPELSLNGVTKRFGGVEAVSNLAMRLKPGSITGLIGPNGAGKTTVINLITGLLAVSTGTIQLDGRDLSRAQPAAIAQLGIARTFQNIRLLKEQSVLANVRVGFQRLERSGILPAILGLPAAERERRDFNARAFALLREFEMERFANYPATGLSYGHQRKVEIMRALAMKPGILLLDEPVAGMNDVEADELGGIYRRLSTEGLTILLIEHNIRFVMEYSDYVYAMNSGRVIAEGVPAEILENQGVIDAYLGG